MGDRYEVKRTKYKQVIKPVSSRPFLSNPDFYY
jgi:hypothetical protein